MKKIIYVFVIPLLLSGCVPDKKPENRTGFNPDSTIVLARKRVRQDDGKIAYTDWVEFQTRTIRHLAGYEPERKPVKQNKYGGRTDMKFESTGFFHVRRIDNRWWAVDPEGCLFLHVAVNSINMGKSSGNQKAFNEKYRTPETWMNETNKLLHKYGFNGSGSWSDTESIIQSERQSASPLAYTININFMNGYGWERGGTYAVPGHTGYPGNAIFVFDENFPEYCDREAEKLAQFKNDPNLFGYFSDNELPFPLKALDGYLSVEDPSDAGYLAASAWLTEKGIREEDVTDDVRNAFLAYMADRYFNIVSTALRKYDPNHMFLGPRLYSSEKSNESFMKTAGKYVDVLSCNYYGRWTPVPEEINNWTAWSEKPFIITEWYVKAEDSGLPNQSGAGWIVKTQGDRGLFYQNYTLGLLESGNCVGWHWFKYQDNDPTLEGAELSNIDANKGIVDNNYEEYTDCLDLMGELNHQVYDLADYFDREVSNNTD